MQHHQFLLSPTGHQIELMKNLVEGPLLVQRLLAMHDAPITTPEEAAAFLDRHWRRLTPHMFEQGGRPPSGMEALILQLAGHPFDMFRLDFDGGCILSGKRGVWFPIPDLGMVTVADPAALASARAGMIPSNAFGLMSSARGFEAMVSFSNDWRLRPISPADVGKVQARNAHSPNSSNKRPPLGKHSAAGSLASVDRVANLAVKAFLRYFGGRVAHSLRLSMGAWRGTTTNFSKLSGRPVSGGLPGLGKRSR